MTETNKLAPSDAKTLRHIQNICRSSRCEICRFSLARSGICDFTLSPADWDIDSIMEILNLNRVDA